MSLMPMRPPAPIEPAVPVEQPEVTALHDALKKIDDTPNTITRHEFRQFEPLFRKDHGLTQSQIEELSIAYRQRFDFYKPTNIVSSTAGATMVLTLPPVFVPVRALAATAQNALLVDANTKLSGTMPKHAATAFGQMADALIVEQKDNLDTVLAYRADYIRLVQAFTETYRGQASNGSTTVETGAAETASSTLANATFEFE